MSQEDDIHGFPGFLIFLVALLSGSAATWVLEEKFEWEGLSSLGVSLATGLVVGYALIFIRRWFRRRG